MLFNGSSYFCWMIIQLSSYLCTIPSNLMLFVDRSDIFFFLWLINADYIYARITIKFPQWETSDDHLQLRGFFMGLPGAVPRRLCGMDLVWIMIQFYVENIVKLWIIINPVKIMIQLKHMDDIHLERACIWIKNHPRLEYHPPSFKMSRFCQQVFEISHILLYITMHTYRRKYVRTYIDT
jgi:hypothetical protein